jgi:ABC-type antimicrobial peptide transport system permease subunit
MQPKDLIYVTLQNFKNRKSRVFFTVLGVAVAIAVVLSLVSFGYGLQKSLLEKITTADALLSLDIFPSDGELIKFGDEVVTKIRAIADVETVSPQANFMGQATFNDVRTESSINVVNPNFFSLDGKIPLEGKFFTEEDSKKIVVSSLIPELFNLTNEEVIGKSLQFTIYIKENPELDAVKEITFGEGFTIVAVVEGGGTTPEIYLDKKDIPGVTVNVYQFGKVKLTSQKAIDGVRNELVNMGFIVSSLSDIVTQANKIFGAIQLTLGIFGVFALVVAAIGLVNTMTISLLERTNEIGIMRAIGAAPRDIKKIFLGESIMIGFLGGVSGILLGIICSEILNWSFNLLASNLGGEPVRLFSYPIWFIAFIILLSTIVGLVGGMWPARRAASMNPLEALRYK